jgi:uncharacterized protein YjbI with pentapeptide repeats
VTITRSSYPPSYLQQKAERKHAEELARLDKIVDNSSEKNRNFFIAYLGLLIYVQAIIFSTTDLQLLVSTDGLKLPLIDLTVPLVGFYVVVPIFVIALHFNFLQNLESHHYKLMRWQAAHTGGRVPRKLIYPFLFDYAILEKDGQFQRLVRIANSLLCYNLAPITLGLLLTRFSDRQEWLATLWHYLCFLFDSILVWQLKKAILLNGSSAKKYQSSTKLRSKLKNFFKVALNILLCWSFFALVSAEMLLTLAVGGTRDEDFVKNVQPWLQPIIRMNFFESEKAWVRILSQIISNPIEWFIPRIAISPNEKIWNPEVPTLETAAKLAGNSDWSNYFFKQGQGVEFKTKNLRFVELPFQYLPRAQMASVHIQSAYLEGINLQGADLRHAQMQNANMSHAELQKANLAGASLKGTELFATKMQGADLSGVNFTNANLSLTQLQGSDLSMSNIKDASSIFVYMQGANLSQAQVGGLSFLSSQLQGSILFETSVSGSDLPKEPILVFGKGGKEKLFDPWKKIENGFFTKTDKEKAYDLEKFSKYFRHAPHELAQSTLVSICKDDFLGEENILSSAKAFRERYRSLQFDRQNDLKNNYEYQDLLIDIDRKLCTLPECADIHDKIEGLNCPSVLKNLKKSKK